MTTPWQEEDEDVEVDDMELSKHSRDEMSESSSDEATGRKIARRRTGGSCTTRPFILSLKIFIRLILRSQGVQRVVAVQVGVPRPEEEKLALVHEREIYEDWKVMREKE